MERRYRDLDSKLERAHAHVAKAGQKGPKVITI